MLTLSILTPASLPGSTASRDTRIRPKTSLGAGDWAACIKGGAPIVVLAQVLHHHDYAGRQEQEVEHERRDVF